MNDDLRKLIREEIHSYFSDPVFINEVISSEVNKNISKDDITKAIESSVDIFLVHRLEPMVAEVVAKRINEKLLDVDLSVNIVTKDKNSKERTKLYE